jgi:hypothetical protein
MQKKIQAFMFYFFLLSSLWVGLALPLYFNKYYKFSMSTQLTYPFVNWSLFDRASLLSQDYLVRVTCAIDPDENKVIESLKDNLCIRGALLNPDEEGYVDLQFQREINDYIAEPEKKTNLTSNLKTIFKINDFQKIIILQRSFKPKEYYLNKNNVRYDVIKTISSE